MAATQAGITSENGKPHTILVVEDDVLIRMIVCEYLRDCGYQVIEAADGEEAVRLLQADTMKVDLVFSDVQMPGAVDGFALSQWVRLNRPGLPVMLTSGHVGAASKAVELCENGPLLHKPYEHQELLRRLRMVLDQAARANDN